MKMTGQQFSGYKVLLFLLSNFLALVLTHKAKLRLNEDGFENFEVKPDKGLDYDFDGSSYENLTEGTEVRRMLPLAEDPCGYSDEAKRVNLQAFLMKVHDTFYALRPHELVSKSNVPVDEFRKKFRLYDPSPKHIKRETDETMELLKELQLMKVNFGKLKPREQKAIKQTEQFVQHVFGTSYREGNYYTGQFLLGPTAFCWEPICAIPNYIKEGFKRFQPASEEEVIQLFQMVQQTFDQYQANMQYGMEAGMVRPLEACKAGIDALKRRYQQIDSKGPEGVLTSWWAKPLLKPKFTANLQLQESQKVQKLMVKYIGAPIHNLLEYMTKEHIKYCVPSEVSSGLASLPLDHVHIHGKPTNQDTRKVLPTGQRLRGADTYRDILSYFATKRITPDEVFEIGQKRLKEIYPEAIKIAQEVTGQKDEKKAITLFVEKINAPQMFFATDIPHEESDARAHKLCNKKDSAQKNCPKRWAAMQKWFEFAKQTMTMLEGKYRNLFHNEEDNPKRTSPKCGIELKANFNPSSAAQSYRVSDKDCTKPAKYYLPFFLDKPGPIYKEWTTNAHEARPGHHYAFQGKEEFFKDNCNDVISWIEARTTANFYAFKEGWALYVETPLIAKDTDTYDGHPLFKYGMIKAEIWRALRLIVDVGLHYKGMRRREGIELFRQYAWDNSDKVLKEMTRYQGLPGQATSYMIGQVQFKQVREYVQTTLQEKFNIKDFHYYLLNTGDIPLGYMEERMKKYASCVIDPNQEGCKDLLNPPRNSDAAHDSGQGRKTIHREMLEDDVWATPEEPVEPIPD